MMTREQVDAAALYDLLLVASARINFYPEGVMETVRELIKTNINGTDTPIAEAMLAFIKACEDAE